MELDGKVAVITGGARGLGKCVMKTLLTKGVKVYFCDINATNGEETRKECSEEFGSDNVFYKQCDVTKEEELKSVFETAKSTFGQIDIVINNAAIIDENQWETTIDVNLSGYIRGTYLGLEYMRKDKGGNGGVIINVSSVSGLTPTALYPGYTASKHGVIGFSRSMAFRPDVKDNGIRLMCLCPNFIDTTLLHQTLDAMKGWDYAVLKRMLDKIGYLR